MATSLMSSLSLKPSAFTTLDKVAVKGLPSLSRRSSTSFTVRASGGKKIKTDKPFGKGNKFEKGKEGEWKATPIDILCYLVLGVIEVVDDGMVMVVGRNVGGVECWWGSVGDGSGFIGSDDGGIGGGMELRDGVDSSGRKPKGKGVYQFVDKYGANVDGYSPIYNEEEWSPGGDVYVGGTTGLLIWAVTLAGLLAGGALLVYNTSALAS
ncbi:Photosystem II 10 kDa polypeptide chloroplastic [Bienertia sinuspersici]